jgi:hypothetical protein
MFVHFDVSTYRTRHRALPLNDRLGDSVVVFWVRDSIQLEFIAAV